ncbi:hypothetical protein KVR01_004744 [Diaporthe batatas]|uniref:uncharacterized protein n=1 Tax=Diaporthe batatas TaxID=748121 RepID=UPI001D050F2E|nr:uncharacterized protein KVR01_004744 [Diaporthe batatas]KAG8166192.1 hypothetical protein KVR01_004744 [Diaporthe batatas]
MAISKSLAQGAKGSVTNNGIDQTQNILGLLPGELPQCTIPTHVSPTDIAQQLIAGLSTLSISQLQNDSMWRDTVALTGTLRTFYTAPTVIEAWNELIYSRAAGDFQLLAPTVQVAKLDESTQWIEASFSFTILEPQKLLCSGFLSIVLSPEGKWKIWVIKTILEQICGQPDVDKLDPVQPAQDDVRQLRNSTNNGIPYFDVAIVGGGMCGLATGGRLKALGVSYVCLESQDRLEDVWGKRYKSAKRCHTPVVPHWPNRDSFRGQVIHSVDYHDAEPWKGLRGIVIGSGNTGHDVASDMVAAGLSSVTMVQRSPTC